MRQAFTLRSSVRSGTHRRSLTGSLIVAVVLAFVGRPGAAEEPPVGVQELARLTVVSARLMGQAKALESLGAYGYSKGACCMYGAAIAPGESVTMRLNLNVGEEYLWFAAGDGNTQDLDIEVIAPDGHTVTKDISSDAVPCIQFSVRQNGKHSLKLSLFEGTGTSFCAVVLMQRDGWAIPLANLGTAFRQFVLSAGSTALLVDQMSDGKLGVRLPDVGTGWCLFGGVMKQGGDSTIENLSLGKGLHVFLAA